MPVSSALVEPALQHSFMLRKETILIEEQLESQTAWLQPMVLKRDLLFAQIVHLVTIVPQLR